MIADSENRVLIVHRGALGDFLLFLPTLQVLRKHFSKCHIIGLGKPQYWALAQKNKLIDSYYNSDSQEFAPFFSGKTLPEHLLPVKLVLSWTLPFGTSAPKGLEKIIYHPPFPKQPTKSICLHHFEVLKHLNISIPSIPTTPILSFSPISKGEVLIHPGSGSPKKNLSPHFYLELFHNLKDHWNCSPKLIIGPCEESIASNFPQNALIRTQTIHELAQYLAGAKYFVGNDSGVSHLAGAVGTPGVAFFLSTNPIIWGMLGASIRCCLVQSEEEALNLTKQSIIPTKIV